MVKRETAIWLRKAHRYLGIFLGIQFLMWTISGIYFSWTDIDEIHGDQFRQEVKATSFEGLLSPNELKLHDPVTSLELKEIAKTPYYWVNGQALYHARTGNVKTEISKEEALAVAKINMAPELKVKDVQRIETVGNHHEYRGRDLPAYVISYNHDEAVKAYVSVKDGSFQRVRHRSWRWFDFLWMTHTMDYEGRDDFNTTVLRAFSLLGLITVLSGFTLWFISSPTVRKITSSNKKRK